MANDILILKENEDIPLDGEVYTLSDLHGNLDVLKRIISQLGENDILILQGDLIDNRNKNVSDNSHNLLLEIIHHNENRLKQGKKPQIYSVKGNHEIILLKAIKKLKQVYKERKNYDNWYNEFIESQEYNHLIKNGGDWFFSLTLKVVMDYEEYFIKYQSILEMELFNEKLLAAEEKSNPLNEEQKINLYDKIYSEFKNKDYFDYYFDKYNEELDGFYSDILFKEINQIEEYLESLPILIHGSKNGYKFNIVHSDNPISDEELNERIRMQNFSLSSSDIDYATWARPNPNSHFPIADKGRTEKSTITYCGHNPGKGLRKDTNSVNTDNATYLTDVIYLINHGKGTCQLVGDQQNIDRLKADYKSNYLATKYHLLVKKELFDNPNLKFYSLLQIEEFILKKIQCPSTQNLIDLNEHLTFMYEAIKNNDLIDNNLDKIYAGDIFKFLFNMSKPSAISIAPQDSFFKPSKKM